MNLIVTSCFLLALLGATNSQSFTTILEAVQDFDLSLLIEAAKVAEIDPFFSDTELDVTLFAPTDAAFVNLLSVLNITLEGLLADKKTLSSVLLYHVMEEVAFSTDLTQGLTLNTFFANQTVTVDLEDGVQIIAEGSTATVTTADIEAGAGVVHIIDTVLLPFTIERSEEIEAPQIEEQESTIVSVASSVPELSTLVEAVIAADLVLNLSNPDSQLTVFAPTNDAFAAMVEQIFKPQGISLQDLLSENQELLKEVLLYHVVPSAAASTDLVNGQELNTLNGEALEIEIVNEDIIILSIGSEANVVTADAAAGKSVVHVIDSVLLPSRMVDNIDSGEDDVDQDNVDAVRVFMEDSIAVIASKTPFLSTLVAAVEAVDLGSALSNSSLPLTVFAPTNTAFENVLDSLGMTLEGLVEDTGMLTEILLYHVVPQALFSTDLENGQELETLLESDTLKVNIQGLNISVEAVGSTAQVEQPDIEAGNGVVHVIDTVLLPFKAEAVVEVLEETEEPGFLERVRDGIVDFFRTIFGFFGIFF